MKVAIRPDQVRSLPIRVPPVAGETVTGFLGRLAHANALTPRDVRLHLTDIAGLSPYHPDLEQAGQWAERLGGLPPGHFERDARRNGMYVRCPHYQWQPTACRHCGYTQQPRSACRRCARGAETTVRSRGGAVCNHHRRWHVDGADLDVAAFPEYAHAERCFSGTLWKRGIGLSTGELQLAASLICAWAADSDLPERIHRRAATLDTEVRDQGGVFLVA